jgi:MYXO-CTERM domain-containing protein
MRYVYSTLCFAVVMLIAVSGSMACEMRSVIRQEIRDNFGSINVDIDEKELENRIHDMIHSKLDREKERLENELRRVREERRQLERERKRLARDRGDDDDDDDDWGKSVLLALGLYGAGLLLLTRRSRRKNAE